MVAIGVGSRVGPPGDAIIGARSANDGHADHSIDLDRQPRSNRWRDDPGTAIDDGGVHDGDDRCVPVGARALDTSDTRLLATPAIAEGKIAFAYADDIWVADADGKNPRRVTSHPGEEQNPYFSPDGKHIAFTASYDGNDDVYVIPAEGGEPTRLTWHPGDDVVRGFTPDGQVLFSSQREVFSRRHSQFFTVGVNGGVPRRLPIPIGRHGGHLARRQVPGLYAARRELPAVEELSRRHGVADLGPQAG